MTYTNRRTDARLQRTFTHCFSGSRVTTRRTVWRSSVFAHR